MNPRSVANIALDVVREAIASWYLIILFVMIALGIVGLALALDIEVVNGAISTFKLFGGSLVGKGKTVPIDEVLAPFMSGIVGVTAVLGLLFLIVAVADIAPKMLAPGRVELLLALPLRRTEVVVGVYLGVLLIGAMATFLAVCGASFVLFVKLQYFSIAPFLAALCTLVEFATIYGVMLAVAAVARSAALSAGFAILAAIAGGVTSDRAWVLSFIRNDFTRTVAGVAIGPLPRLKSLVEIGIGVTTHKAIDWSNAAAVIGGCAAFGFFFVVAACIVINIKDY